MYLLRILPKNSKYEILLEQPTISPTINHYKKIKPKTNIKNQSKKGSKVFFKILRKLKQVIYPLFNRFIKELFNIYYINGVICD